VIRAFLPGARSVEVLRRGGSQPIGRSSPWSPTGCSRAPVTDRGSYICVSPGRRPMQETEDPYSFGPLLGELDLHLFNEGRHFEMAHAFGANGRRSRAQRRGLRCVGAQRRARRRRRRLQLLGLAAPSDAVALSPRASGSVRAAARRGERYKFDIVGAAAYLLPQKPTRVAAEPRQPPHTRLIVASPEPAHWRDKAGSTAARRHAADAPISIYEAIWLVAAPRTAVSWDKAANADPLRRRHGLHPSGAAADHRASVRRLVGLPAALAVRADRPLSARRKALPASSTACMRPASAHPRLGAGALPDRRARARALRRHRALRAPRSARGISIATGTPTSTISAGARCRAS
jgi:hypothetical protein